MRSLTLGFTVLWAFFGAFVACSDDEAAPGVGSGQDAGPGGSSGGIDTDGGGNGGADGGGGAANLTWTAGTVGGPDGPKVGAVKAMAYGGGHFVAWALAHEGGIVDNIVFALASTDGKAWTVTQKFGLRYSINAIAWYGTKFVGVGTAPDGEGGSKNIYATSADGAAWTFIDGPGDGTYAVAAGADRAVWGGQEGLSTTWVSGQAAVHRAASPLSINMYAICNVGTRWIATGQLREVAAAGEPLFLYSDDPSSTTATAWKAAQEPVTSTRVGSLFRGIHCDDALQVAVGSGKDVFVSKDRGESWTSAVSEGDSTTWTNVQKANGKLVIVGWKGAYGVTTDGADLATGKIGVERDFGVAASNGSLVVTASDGNYNDHMPAVFYWTSP